MKCKIRLLGVILVLLMMLDATFVLGTMAQDTEDPITRIDTWLTKIAEDDLFSGSVLVARGDEILLSEGYGFAVRGWNIANTADTRFLIADQTELFTATAIMLLQERGLLSIQDPICNYLEDCPDAWQDITIHHLLSHTTGISNLLLDFSRLELALPLSYDRIVEVLTSKPLLFALGEEFNFGSDYIILGQIFKGVTGQSYETFMRENILEPLALNDTDFLHARNIVERFAEGYQSNYAIGEYVHPRNFGASYGMYSTVEDLYRWHQALRDGTVVSGESWETMSEAKVQLDDRYVDSYGYGMFQASIAGHAALWDGGWGLMGYGNSRFYLTDADITIIMLSNLESAHLIVNSELIAKMLLPED